MGVMFHTTKHVRIDNGYYAYYIVNTGNSYILLVNCNLINKFYKYCLKFIYCKLNKYDFMSRLHNMCY